MHSRRLAHALIASLLLCAAVVAQSSSSQERALFDAANRERKAQGLASLKWDEALATAARKHAEQMASHGSAGHQFPGEPSLPGRATKAGAHFLSLAENVDQGPTATTVHESFMKSPLHRANILDRDMDSVGIGIAISNGQLFVVEDFSKAKSSVVQLSS
jgi:uncharacterized protein YkwD